MIVRNWFDVLFHLCAPFGVAAAIYNDAPILAAGMAFCLGNLFQIDLRKWIESR